MFITLTDRNGDAVLVNTSDVSLIEKAAGSTSEIYFRKGNKSSFIVKESLDVISDILKECGEMSEAQDYDDDGD